MDHLRGKAIIASGFHAIQQGSIDHFHDALFVVGDKGEILSVCHPHDDDYAERRKRHAAAGTLVTLPAGSYLLPGFVDLHVHAPQYPQLGNALDVPLEIWLQKHTFPLEARYADLAFARQATVCWWKPVANGTTTALYFATIHQEATRALVDISGGWAARGDRQGCDGQCGRMSRLLPRRLAGEAIRGTQDPIGYVTGHPDNTRRG